MTTTTTAKAFFNEGDKPTETEFAAVIDMIGERTAIVASVTAMEALTTAQVIDFGTFYLEGYASAGDSGEGFMTYFASAAASANGGTIFALGSAATGRIIRQTNFITPYMFGAKGDNAADDTLPIQAAIDFGVTSEIRVLVEGNFKITAKIVIKSNFMGSNATFNCDTITSGPAVEISTGSATDPLDNIRYKHIWVPTILYNKVGTGWPDANIGLRVVNAKNCQIYLTRIEGFQINLQEICFDNGSAWNHFYGGFLDNGKINLQITSNDGSGAFINENSHWGLRFDQLSGEGTNVSGVRHVQILGGFTEVPNGHKFYSCAIESVTPEFHVDCFGTHCKFMDCRWDVTGGARVNWDATAAVGNGVEGSSNGIIRGGQASALMTITEDAQCRRNYLWNQDRFVVNGKTIETRNESSDTANSLVTYDTTQSAILGDPQADYRFGAGAETVGGKLKADTDNRWELRNRNPGELRFGDGSNTPDTNLKRIAANTLQTDDQMIAIDGFVQFTKAGVPVDGDFTVLNNGLMAIDTTNSKIYVRIGGAWKSVSVA